METALPSGSKDVCMLPELVIRFIIGGLVVSAFAVIGDMLRPKAFAGIFGAAPSVALATLGLTLMMHGGSYAGIEGRSMLAGGIALFLYSVVSYWLLSRRAMGTLPGASLTMLSWFASAFVLWGAFLR
jgi:hypothetical protein